MNQKDIDYYRTELEHERISYGELAEIDRQAIIAGFFVVDTSTEELLDMLEGKLK